MKGLCNTGIMLISNILECCHSFCSKINKLKKRCKQRSARFLQEIILDCVKHIKPIHLRTVLWKYLHSLVVQELLLVYCANITKRLHYYSKNKQRLCFICNLESAYLRIIILFDRQQSNRHTECTTAFPSLLAQTVYYFFC